MKLTDLIDYLTRVKQLEELYQKYNVSQDSEALLIYLQNKLSLQSPVIIFEIEETDDYLVFEKEGVKYEQLFSVNHTIELLEDLELKDNGHSNLEIAKRLLKYRKNDA